MSTPIVLAYKFDGEGSGSLIDEMKAPGVLKSETLAWVHLDAAHTDTHAWLTRELDYLDPFIIDALLAEETRPRMTQIDDGALIILRGVNLNENSAPEDMVSIRLWVDNNRIISVRRRTLKAALDISESLQAGRGPTNSGDFICALTARLFSRMQPALTQLDDHTDSVEERILEGAGRDLREEIISIRKKAITFRRYMAPQRDAIDQLKATNVSWLDDGHRRLLHESYNHVTRYVEDLDAIRERAQIIKDEIASVLADSLNKNMYVLSVIAAIFLPISFATGLLGVNIAGIPGTENPYAFSIFCGVLVLVSGSQLYAFKKLKWL